MKLPKMPTCPTCGSPLIIYSDYLACERLDCGGLLTPYDLGIRQTVQQLARQFQGRQSVSNAARHAVGEVCR